MYSRYIIFFILIELSVKAQVSIVPNKSFDMTYQCPTSEAGIGLGMCLYWFDPTKSSSDYFDTCTNNKFPKMGVPQNFYGNQNPRTGKSYAGIYAYEPFLFNGPNVREYVSVELTSPLETNTIYSVSFYVSLADSMQYAVNNISALLSKNSYPLVTSSSPFDTLIASMPQINNTSSQYLNSKSDWMKISGVFKANGGEKYLTIGNFQQNKFLDIEKLNCCSSKYEYKAAYYYIDDVEITEQDSVLIPNVFTPNYDGVNDLYGVFLSRNKLEILSIYNRWGQKVFETTTLNEKWDGNTKKGEYCDNGSYFYTLIYSTRTGERKSLKGFIELFR